jgi:hypothetical protein
MLRDAGFLVGAFGVLLGCGVQPRETPADDDDGSGGSSQQASGSGAASTSASSGGGMTAPGGYYTEGNQIYDENGQVHIFRGMARPSLEWSKNGENLSPQDYQNMASWGANVVRIALNQGFWLSGSSVYAPEYQGNVTQSVSWALAAGLDVILDLHWTDKGNFGNVPAAQRMADQNSIAFWQSVAGQFKDEGRVLFELYNEPHDISWSVWRNGGDSGDGFQAVGMQTLYDSVRATGAENIVIIGGLNYAFDLSGVDDNRINGYNIVYATHVYNFADKQPPTWEYNWGYLTATDPVFITEFGNQADCSANYTQEVVNHAAMRGLSWTAWAWYVGGCEFPSLITDWSGVPSAQGQVVRTALSM